MASIITRLRDDLHRRLKQEAEQLGLSLNALCVSKLSSAGAAPGQGGALRPLQFSGQVKEIVDAALSEFGEEIEGMVLYGSVARGDAVRNSDVDVLVVLRQGTVLDRSIYSRWPITKSEGREVSPLFVRLPGTDEEIRGIWLEVAVDGIVCFDREFKVSRFLSKARNLIADGVARRLKTHGHPYWVYNQKRSEAEESKSGS